MRKFRVAAAATVIALVASFVTMGRATAATPNGVGTTETSSALVDLALGTAGSLLRIQLLPDEALATIDPAKADISAFSKMSALKVTSSVLPAPLNNISLPANGFSAAAPVGQGSVTGPALNLGSVVPAAIASGSLVPVSLTAAVDNAKKTATSGIDATLANLGLAGGILSVESVTSKLGAAGKASTSDGFRGLSLDAISVLDLDTLLKGLGIDINNLPISIVSGLIDSLNLRGLTGLTQGQNLSTVTGLLNTALDELDAVLAQVPGGSGVGSLLNSLIPGLELADLTDVNNAIGILGQLPLDVDDPLSTVTGLLTTLTDVLTDLLETAVGVLNDVSLLSIEALDIGTVTKAASTTGDSSADVIGKIGKVKIGGLDLGSLDLTGTLSTVTGALSTVTSVLDGVLAPLGLDGLLHIGILEKPSTNGVSTSGGYVRSLAGITGLNISLTPPADLLGILDGLPLVDGIGGTLDGLIGGATDGVGVPALGGGALSMLGLNNLLGDVVPNLIGALAGGASIKVASMSSGSNFTAPGAVATAPTPVSQLPRTGIETTAFLVIGMLMVGGVLAGRRFLPLAAKSE